MVGGGDGIMLAIPPSGDLTFFRYTGNGEADETGSMGFEGPHQATVIGNGFHTFPHVFVSPREGRAARTTLFVVNEAGDLLWFRYSGDGEPDASGTLGFEGPNQGNQIGRGFTGFRHIVGVGGGAFLAVPENGDLLWFQYTGKGEQDPTGASGFTEQGNNSGNQIGRGFTDFRHLFGGSTDHGGRAAHLLRRQEQRGPALLALRGQRRAGPDGSRGVRHPLPGDPDRQRVLTRGSARGPRPAAPPGGAPPGPRRRTPGSIACASGPISTAYRTVPMPSAPPSSSPTTTTPTSSPVRTTRSDPPVTRASPVISPSRGPRPSWAPM